MGQLLLDFISQCEVGMYVNMLAGNVIHILSLYYSDNNSRKEVFLKTILLNIVFMSWSSTSKGELL